MTNAGELIVKIPKDAYSSAYWGETTKYIHYPEIPPKYVFLNSMCLFLIKVPSLSYLEVQPIKVQIEFSLEQPKGGVRFVIPSPGTPENMVLHLNSLSFSPSPHLYIFSFFPSYLGC